jgi:hypothetical protein
MANQRIAKLTAPTIRLEGLRVHENVGKDTETGVWNIDAPVYESPDSNDNSSKDFTVNNGRTGQSFVFINNVDINMTVSGHSLRSRDNTIVPAGRPVFYGDLAGVLGDTDQADTPEVRYTINGKDPSRTKFYRWGIDDDTSIKLQMNKTGVDTVIRARTYHRGRWSDVTLVRIKVTQGSIDLNQKQKTNADDNGNTFGDPMEGQDVR